MQIYVAHVVQTCARLRDRPGVNNVLLHWVRQGVPLHKGPSVESRVSKTEAIDWTHGTGTNMDRSEWKSPVHLTVT